MGNPNIAEIARKTGARFQPGHPGYKKPGTKAKKTIAKEFIEFCKDAIKEPALQAALQRRAKKSPAFARILTDYGAGKPPDRIELSGKDGEPLKVILQVRKEGDDDGNV